MADENSSVVEPKTEKIQKHDRTKNMAIILSVTGVLVVLFVGAGIMLYRYHRRQTAARRL